MTQTPTLEELIKKTEGNLVETLALDITHKIEANPKKKLPKPFQQFVFSIYENLFITALNEVLGKYEEVKKEADNAKSEDEFLDYFAKKMEENEQIAETFSNALAKQYEILCSKYSIKSVLKNNQ